MLVLNRRFLKVTSTETIVFSLSVRWSLIDIKLLLKTTSGHNRSQQDRNISESRTLWHTFTGMDRRNRDSQADSMVRTEEQKHIIWDWKGERTNLGRRSISRSFLGKLR